MTREDDENETGGVSGYAMVVNERMVHLGMHHFLRYPFAILRGKHARAKIRSGNTRNPGRSRYCPSGLARKLVLLEHCLGEWSQECTRIGWGGRKTASPSPIF